MWSLGGVLCFFHRMMDTNRLWQIVCDVCPLPVPLTLLLSPNEYPYQM